MTENEAIVFIKNANELSETAIHDLEEIKDKAERIGRIGEYYANLENCYKEIEACEVAIKSLEEIQQYRAIGTVDECREARERQIAKKPDIGNDNGRKRNCCSVCGCFYAPTSRYCPKCGQAIKQSE